MDAVSQTEPVVRQLRPPDAAGDGVIPCMPPEAALAMPPQSLSQFDPAERRRDARRHGRFGTLLARLFVFGGGLALTAYGAHEMYQVVAVGGVTFLEWALLILFVANFSWIALAFTNAIAGLFWMAFVAPRGQRFRRRCANGQRS